MILEIALGVALGLALLILSYYILAGIVIAIFAVSKSVTEIKYRNYEKVYEYDPIEGLQIYSVHEEEMDKFEVIGEYKTKNESIDIVQQ